MKPKERVRAHRLANAISLFSQNVRPLRGIVDTTHLDCFVAQIVDSLRRVEFAQLIGQSRHDPRRMDPTNDLFDPLKAAVLRAQAGDMDEAFWLVFLATHFGKHAVDGWRLARDIYGKLGGPGRWDWATISADPNRFRAWLNLRVRTLRTDGVRRRFSNHRKYETLVAANGSGTAEVFESYITWVQPPRTHSEMIREVHGAVGQDPERVFDHLYLSMASVRRFGRLAKFDYLTMLGKLGLAPIEPGSTYLNGATGPQRGARLLFYGDPMAGPSIATLEHHIKELGTALNVGMQAMEDSLCNWQKSPSRYVHFTG